MVYIKSDISTHFEAINNLDSESVNLYRKLLIIKEKECEELNEIVNKLINEIGILQKQKQMIKENKK